MSEKRKGWRPHYGSNPSFFLFAEIGLCDLYQFDIENEVFAGQRVVGIEHNGFVIHFEYNDRENVAVVVAHLELHTYGRLHVFGKFVDGIFYHHFFVMLAISVSHNNFDNLFVAGRHEQYRIIESFDYLAIANHELERSPAFRTVENASITKSTAVVYTDSVAFFYLLHCLTTFMN